MRPLTTSGLLCVAAALSLGSLAYGASSDRLPSAQAQAGDAIEPKPAEASAKWPASLLRVGEPGATAKVPLGITSTRALELADTFYKYNKTKALHFLAHVSSELGEGQNDVRSFYLSKFPVTNEQYLRYVKAANHRFPFHWWKFGKPAEFQEARPKVHKAFPDDKGIAPILYWERNWKDLPYAIPKGEEKHPVRFVSWADAMDFAAWAGMRLPTESEWTLAANGGERKDYVFGPKWDPAILEDLGMETARDWTLRPVGGLGPKAQGPFGHGDMLGQVWEWVIPLGFLAQTNKEANQKEYEKLRKEYEKLRKDKDQKLGSSLPLNPDFRPEFAVIKGGSVFSFTNQDFQQLRINCRAPLETHQTMEGVGFRLAKSERAAYDMSLVRVKRNYPGFLPGGLEPDLAGQVGVERYDLENGGEIISDYHAISFVPMNYLTLKKSKSAMVTESQIQPLPLGVLITTCKLKAPATEKGLHVVYFRKRGLPKKPDVAKALKEARADLKKIEKKRAAAEKKGEKYEPTDAKAPGKNHWRSVLRPYGYTDEEILAAKNLSSLTKYVYVRHTGELNLPKDKDGKRAEAKHEDKWFKVSTEHNVVLLRHHGGNWTGSMEATTRWDNEKGAEEPNTIADLAGKSEVDLRFIVPTDPKEWSKKTSDRKWRGYPFKLRFELDKPWK